MTGIYKIADRVIEIVSLHREVHDYCGAYRYDGAPDFTVEISQEDIDRERGRNARTVELEGRRPRDPSDEYLEGLAVYRKISERMLDYDTFLFHGSCVAVDGEGYLFTAKSGTGKSTHTRLWREYLGERAVMVNDDKPLIRAGENGLTVFGTPYNGKHRLGENIAVPLKAVCILERSAENRIETVTREQAYPILLQQTYRPADPLLMEKTLVLIDRMAEKAKLCRLRCNMDISAAVTAYEGMK